MATIASLLQTTLSKIRFGLDCTCQRLTFFRTTLDGQHTKFNPDCSLEKVDESNEEIHDDLCPHIVSKAKQAQNANKADRSIDHELTDGCDDSDFQFILTRPGACTANWAVRERKWQSH